MEKFILERIEKAFKSKNQVGESEIDKEAVKEQINAGDVIRALEMSEYFEVYSNQDVKEDLIKYIHEELIEIEFPGDLTGFDYEIKKGRKALIEFLEQKEKTDLENEILENLKKSNSFADVDLYILEERVLKFKDKIVKKIKEELDK